MRSKKKVRPSALRDRLNRTFAKEGVDKRYEAVCAGRCCYVVDKQERTRNRVDDYRREQPAGSLCTWPSSSSRSASASACPWGFDA